MQQPELDAVAGVRQLRLVHRAVARLLHHMSRRVQNLLQREVFLALEHHQLPLAAFLHLHPLLRRAPHPIPPPPPLRPADAHRRKHDGVGHQPDDHPCDAVGAESRRGDAQLLQWQAAERGIVSEERFSGQAQGRKAQRQLAGEIVVRKVEHLEASHRGEGLRYGSLEAFAAEVEALEATEAREEHREIAGEAVGVEVKNPETVTRIVGPRRRRYRSRESVAVEAELGEAVAELPYGGRERAGEGVAGEVELGQSGRVAELERDGAGERVGGELE